MTAERLKEAGVLACVGVSILGCVGVLAYKFTRHMLKPAPRLLTR